MLSSIDELWFRSLSSWNISTKHFLQSQEHPENTPTPLVIFPVCVHTANEKSSSGSLKQMWLNVSPGSIGSPLHTPLWFATDTIPSVWPYLFRDSLWISSIRRNMCGLEIKIQNLWQRIPRGGQHNNLMLCKSFLSLIIIHLAFFSIFFSF